MKRLALAALLALCATSAHAGALVPVADQDGMCPRYRTGFCHEWALEDDSRLRVLFRGFADGASHSLYRRTGLGQYHHLFDFEPVLQEGDDGALRLEYLGDASPLELATVPGREVVVFASFDVPWEREGAESVARPFPRWQQRKPALLFKRTVASHVEPAPRQHFTPITPEKLRKATKRARVGCATPPVWDTIVPCR